MILFFTSFSLSSVPISRISAFTQFGNMTVSSSMKLSNQFSSHPVFIFGNTLSSNSFSLSSTVFAKFSAPILHSIGNTQLNIRNVTFKNSIRPIYINSAYIHHGTDFKTHEMYTTPSVFVDCSFNKLSYGTEGDGFGGAVQIYRSIASFQNCIFINNLASTGGACSFNNSEITLEGCSFASNTANLDGGAIYSYKSKIKMEQVNFVKNSAGVHAGAIKVQKSNITGNKVILHRNKDAFKTSGVESSESTIRFINSQFSKNNCEHKKNGIIFHISSTYLTLEKCKFQTLNRNEDDKKLPINADANSVVTILGSCFDMPKTDLALTIEGDFKDNDETQYDTDCKCQPIDAIRPYDVTEFNIQISSSKITKQFIFSACSIFFAVDLIYIYLFCHGAVVSFSPNIEPGSPDIDSE